VALRTEYAPGTFSWCDLTTADQDGAKAFYCELFGWTAEDMPVGDGVVYSMMLRDGKRVAAISPQPERQRDAGAPTMWNSYISVTDADAIVERAKELGGAAHAPAFDVMDAGRLAVLQDPEGAFFMVWQAGQVHGAELVTDTGALVWNELATADLDAATAFYGELFGWTFNPFEGSPAPYSVIVNAGRSNGGIAQPETAVPPCWLPYFGVADLDAALATVERLGGRTHLGPMELPMARVALAVDPQGAAFWLYAGEYEA
jgi:predicted enzyme related to lactoylglutathione lyase